MTRLKTGIVGLAILASILGGCYVVDKYRQEQAISGGKEIVRPILEKDFKYDSKTYVSSLEDFIDSKGLDQESPQYAYEKQLVERIDLTQKSLIESHEKFKDLLKEKTEDKVLSEIEIRDLYFHVNKMNENYKDLRFSYLDIGKGLKGLHISNDPSLIETSRNYSSLENMFFKIYGQKFDDALQKSKLEVQLEKAELSSKVPGSEDFKPWRFVYLLPLSILGYGLLVGLVDTWPD